LQEFLEERERERERERETHPTRESSNTRRRKLVGCERIKSGKMYRKERTQKDI
jgi:hypothetical protein